jgi:RNA-directed DNA polymerase
LDAIVVNGPEDEAVDWDSVDWDSVDDNVRRLRQRIFTASRNGDLAKVRNLQKLMLRSRSNILSSVRRVTEMNQGRMTAGVDGKVIFTSQDKVELARWMQHGSRSWNARPVRRVYIPKSNGSKRPLGIPVIVDRALQAQVKNALEPEWESRFESKSYGFRPGRGCHDAIAAIFTPLCGNRNTRGWVLDADLSGAFDRISHDHLIRELGNFPGRRLIGQWLTAGVDECGTVSPTDKGTPQGGVISPLLMNVALHGMEEAAGVRTRTDANAGEGWVLPSSPILVRYADDFIVLCRSSTEAESVRDRLRNWLEPRGLSFNQEKTRVVSVDEGFDFLGFNIRRQSGKLLIKPSKDAVKRIRERLSREMRDLRGANASAVIQKLNPIIRGWAAYYRGVVSTEIFQSLDHYVWKLTYAWGLRSHLKKPKRWVANRYFGTFHKDRADRWVFGDRDSGAYLVKFAWTKIVRHQGVKGRASPDDPTLTAYWEGRRKRKPPQPLSGTYQRLLKEQQGRCALCGDLLLFADQEPQSPQEWEQWQKVVRKAVKQRWITYLASNAADVIRLRLIHEYCRRKHRHVIGKNLVLPQNRAS